MATEAGANACVVICVLIAVGAIIAALVIYLQTRSSYNRYNTPNKELLNLLNDRDDVITRENLRAMVKKVVKLQPAEIVVGGMFNQYDQKEINDLLKAVTDPNEATAETYGKIERLTGARDEGKLPILKETRATIGFHATSLHVSKLTDLYGNPIYLAAAPLAAQFADQWELIWQEQIGVIVWIGRFKPQGQPVRMEAYIDLHRGQTASYGKFQVTTTKIEERMMRFTVYEVSVDHLGVKRTLEIVHAYEWLQESVSWALRREVEMIVMLKDKHLEQMQLGFPGIMFQCKWGTAGSPVMAAVYIGFQTWLRCKKVNLMGIAKHVRRHRWKAFQETGDDSHTFLVQLKVLFATFYGVAMFIDEKELAVFDQWLKSVLVPDTTKKRILPS